MSACRGSYQCPVPGCLCACRQPESLRATLCRCCEAHLTEPEQQALNYRGSAYQVDCHRRKVRRSIDQWHRDLRAILVIVAGGKGVCGGGGGGGAELAVIRLVRGSRARS